MSDLRCSVCLYVPHRTDLDDDALAELQILTVVNGQMVCLRHVPAAHQSHHDTLKAGVQMESGDERMALTAWQDLQSRRSAS